MPLLVACLFCVACPSFGWAGEWTEINDGKQRVAVAGFVLDFGETGRNEEAFVSQGPIVITDDRRRTCQVSEDVELVGWPINLWRNRHLYVDTFSGEAERFFVVDLHTCRTMWSSPTYYGGPAVLHGERLLLPGFKPWRIGTDGLPTRRP